MNTAPSGKSIRATGLIAKFNPFRFYTKFQDDETDLLLLWVIPFQHGTAIGRNRPGKEGTERNLYGFLANR